MKLLRQVSLSLVIECEIPEGNRDPSGAISTLEADRAVAALLDDVMKRSNKVHAVFAAIGCPIQHAHCSHVGDVVHSRAKGGR